jgi:hypothetical protein
MIGLGWGVAGLLVFPIGVVADHIGLYWTLIIISSLSFVGLILSLTFSVIEGGVRHGTTPDSEQDRRNCEKKKICTQENVRPGL